MAELLMHPLLKSQVESFVKSPAHGLLIAGLPGSGKQMIGRYIAAKLLDIDMGSALDSYPYFFHISRPEGKQEIPIESIRALNKKLQLKTPGTRGVRRLVLIEDAHTMSHEAQNALLKNLEEPSDDTVFLLSAPSDRSVLPTIASRVRHLYVPPVSLDLAKKYYDQQYPEAEIVSAWQLSQGVAGLLNAILTGNKNHPMNNAVELAKDFLRATPYKRLIMIDSLSKDRQQMVLFLDALSRVSTALERGAIAQNLLKQNKALLESRKLINQLQNAIEDNAAIRLVALQLVLNLKV